MVKLHAFTYGKVLRKLSMAVLYSFLKSLFILLLYLFIYFLERSYYSLFVEKMLKQSLDKKKCPSLNWLSNCFFYTGKKKCAKKLFSNFNDSRKSSYFLKHWTAEGTLLIWLCVLDLPMIIVDKSWFNCAIQEKLLAKDKPSETENYFLRLCQQFPGVLFTLLLWF